MNRAKLLGTLGLARRAGKLLLGEDTLLDALRKETVLVAFLAADAGPNTAKRIRDKTAFRGVPLIASLTGTELAAAVGRPTLKVAGLADRGFADLCLRAANAPEQS